ncbi:MAG: hypothetical protein LBD90_00230 [Bifidobacteriaceae bacterium]|jgi:Tfp pilus assembly protein PilO|nr:hypothetical protein [Bifidobacteriaceae bacterium]
MKPGQKSTTYIALGVVLVLGMAALCYFLLYSPVIQDRATADANAADIEMENELASQELRSLQARQATLPELQAELEAVRAEFPTSLELSQFTNYLAALVGQTGAEVQTLTPHDPVQLLAALPLPAGPGDYPAPVIAQPPSSLYQYQFTIEIQGTWTQVNDYLKLLQADDARIFMVTEVSTKVVDQLVIDAATGTLAYSIQGYTYALVPADQLPVQAQ